MKSVPAPFGVALSSTLVLSLTLTVGCNQMPPQIGGAGAGSSAAGSSGMPTAGSNAAGNPGAGGGQGGTAGSGGDTMEVGGGGSDSGGAGAGAGGDMNGGTGGDELSGGTGGAGGVGGSGGEGEPYFPLLDGARWLYDHFDDAHAQLTEQEDERMVACSSRPELCAAWSEYDPASNGFWVGKNPDDPDAGTPVVLVRQGSLVIRVHQWEEDAEGVIFEVDYEPGFPRFDDEWTGAAPDTAFPYEYQRTRWDMGVADVPEARTQIYTVVAQSEMVTVAAGVFDCIKVLRTSEEDLADPTRETQKHLWFARGVGKIKEQNLDGDRMGYTEELTRFEPPL